MVFGLVNSKPTQNHLVNGPGYITFPPLKKIPGWNFPKEVHARRKIWEENTEKLQPLGILIWRGESGEMHSHVILTLPAFSTPCLDHNAFTRDTSPSEIVLVSGLGFIVFPTRKSCLIGHQVPHIIACANHLVHISSSWTHETLNAWLKGLTERQVYRPPHQITLLSQTV